VAATLALGTGVSRAGGIVPPAEPPGNVSPNPYFYASCGPGTSIDNSPSCIQSTVSAISNAGTLEGLGPMLLPANYAQMTPAQQVFVTTNLERVDRGLPPIAGMVDSLNGLAQQGVANGSDPGFQYSFPSGGHLASGGSNWAAGYASALGADYGWMYDDGPGGPNLDCQSPGAPGCWGHRNNILEPDPCFCTLVMGAAAGPSPWGMSYTEVIEAVSGPAPPISFSWSQVDVPAARPATQGYRFVASDGGVFDYGLAPFLGSMGGLALNRPIVGMASTPDHQGYWLVASDGGIFTFGDAGFYGSTGGTALNRPIVGMAATPDGHGYWLVASDGGIFTFGDAAFHGSTGGMALNQPVVGMAVDQATGGYWLVASDGGIFSFDAPFYGSTGGLSLNRPIVGMQAVGNGTGYRFVASDGGVFTFGSAPFLGSMGGTTLNRPVVGIAGTRDGQGYWLVASDGGVFTFGDAEFDGSAGWMPLAAPIVGVSCA
jgi:hypothetical protein